MKYTFRENESFIQDLLSFPGVIYYDEKEDEKNEDIFHELISESSRQTAREMAELALPFKDRITPFYYEPLADPNLYQILGMTNPVIGHEDIFSYFEELSEKSDEDLLYSLVFALDYYEQDTGEEDRALSQKKAEEIVSHPEKIMSWLSSLSIGSDAKWHLLAFTQEPKKTLDTFMALIRDIHPVFLNFYNRFEKDVKAFGHDFIRRLEEEKGDSLASVSNGVVSESLLQKEEMDIVISIVNAYSVMLNAAHKVPFISWGYEIENIFRAIAEKEENLVQERVLLFKNFGDKTRYEVIANIAKGITSTKIIAKNLGVSPATISYHLNNLITAKVIFLKQIEGKYTYHVNKDFIRKCLEELKEDFSIDQ